MIIGRYHFRLKMYQVTKHTVQCHRVLRHQHHIHWCRISGTWSVPFHRNNSVHNIEPRFYILIQINQHSRKTVCTRIKGMSLRLMESIDKAITVFYCAGNSLQRMRLHLAKRNHTVFFQKFFRQNKFFCLNPLRIFYTYSLRIINCRNPILFQIPVDSGTMNHSGCRTITTGISK